MGRAKGLGQQTTLDVGKSSVATPELRPGEGPVVDTQVDDSLPSLGPPSLRRLGRYVVLGELGRGGMGMVLRGYDEQLERPVAIKVLHEYLGSRPIARLRREARVMAKLSHPNVVQVYEVGEHEGQTFVAMEMVKGQTVQTWMEQHPRPGWKACVELFLQLGEGLVAAHRRGLVHRDFKPGNAVVDEDGRARVLDFGLARGGDEGDDAGESARFEPDKSDSLLPPELAGRLLTRTGAVIGTPAYMSLEQANGLEADARSDQFSFCVSLYEALYGERPYDGDTPNTLMAAIERGVVRDAPRSSEVPLALRKVLLRGLAPEPGARWPSMESLLEQLRRVVAPRRRRAVVGVTVGVGLLAVGVGLAVPRTLEWLGRCSGARDQLAGVWDDAQRQAVESAILGTELSYAPSTWSRVEPQLDAYADAWAAEHTEACEATRTREEQSEEQMDLRMRCLHKRRQQLRATVGELARADTTVVEHAVVAVASLSGMERCRDLEALRAAVPPPEDPVVAQRAAALEGQLMEAVAKRRAGKYEEGLRLADRVVREGVALKYEPLMARAWLAQGWLRQKNGDYEGAVQALRQAYEAAVARVMRPEAADAATWLVITLSHGLSQHDEARRWAEHADPLSRAAGTGKARGEYLMALGQLAYAQAEYAQARDFYEQSRVLIEESFGPEHPRVASLLGNHAAVAFAQKNYEHARSLQQTRLAIYEKTLGPDHPVLADVLQNLGTLANLLGDGEEGRQLMEKALAVKENALGPEHPRVAFSLHNLGVAAMVRRSHDEARQLLGRALAIRERALGRDHTDVAYTLSALGMVADAQGRYEDARALHERALKIWGEALGPDHPDLVPSLQNLAVVARRQKKLEEAYRLGARTLAIQDKAFGPDHPVHMLALNGAAEDLIGLARLADALVLLERALSIGTTHEVDLEALATTRFDLAYVLWKIPEAEGRDRARARALAERARDDFASLGDAGRLSLSTVEGWLARNVLP